MDTAQITHNIRLIKQDNAQWLMHANALIEGFMLSKKAVPSYLDDCNACQWLYEHSSEFSASNIYNEQVEVDLFHFDIIEQIIILRYELRDHYLQIFRTHFPTINHSFFATLFATEQPLQEYDIIASKRHYKEMREIAGEIGIKLDQLEMSLYDFCTLNIA